MRWAPVLLGQVLAALNTGTGVFTELLVRAEINIPVFQMCCLYFLLCVAYWPLLIVRRCGSLRLASSWKFLLASLFDSQANVVIVLSYQYTSITSVQILLNSTLLWVVLLSYVCLKRRFTRKEYIGVCLAVIGVLCTIVSDLWSAGWQWGGSMFGDCLVLASALLYASSNVWQEYIMTTGTLNYEFLSMLGLFSSLLTLTESMPLEIPGIRQLHTVYSVLSLCGFVACMLGIYSITPFYFQWYGASLFNMSLLTSNAYALLFSIFLFGNSVQWLYFLGYGFVVIGILTYNHRQEQPDSKSMSHLLTDKALLSL